jgi:hypothetical protein
MVTMFGSLAFLIVSSTQASNPHPAPPSVPSGSNQVTANTPASPLEQPLRLLADANQNYLGVRDYTCLFIKKEKIKDKLQPENLIEMKVRTQPFSVYMRWFGPKNLEGQEVCFVTGKNDGKMRVHSTGILGIAGFVTIDTRDPRVMDNSRHTIAEAGIGNLLARLTESWEMERRLNKTLVRIGEYSYNKRPCTRVETVHPEKMGDRFTSYRTVVYFDKAMHLPIRIEKYDWPKPGGPPEGELLENYSYVNLQTNVGLGDAVFNR